MGEGEGLVVQDLVAELARVAEEGVEVGVEELLHLQREPWLQQPRHAAQPPQAPGNVAACSISLSLITDQSSYPLLKVELMTPCIIA